MKQSIYKSYSDDQINELQSQYLLSSWSFSKVSAFARNEKAFEMSYIFGMHGKRSSTAIAGEAYHEALKEYFEAKQKGHTLDLIDLEATALEYIKNIRGNKWKIQKTTPTIEDCVLTATKTATQLLANFYKERGLYEDNIKEIIGVELRCEEYLTINGVDIPLPCHAIIDLIVETTNGKIAVIDHKSKKVYTDEQELALAIGRQAITYVNVYEEHSGIEVNEVWFVENKYAKNKDESQQLVMNRVTIDENTRRLYESLLYEPLKRMIEAVSNPDYVYLINDSDNFVDKAELYDFWCKTLISEIEDFSPEDSKRDLIAKRLKKIYGS